MNRGGAHFTTEELKEVLCHYDIGPISQTMPLNAGNKSAPKVVVISEKGKFVLKRRPRGKDDVYRVAFSHSVQTHLSEKNFPVTTLVTTADEKNTILQINNHIYELFQFITGFRYDGRAESTIDSGRQLALFHKNLVDFGLDWKPLRTSFHDSSSVRRHLKSVNSDKAIDNYRKLKQNVELLTNLYNDSSIRVNQLGYDSWDQQVIHGDWHPGNMLFGEGKVIAVLDFDSIRVAPTISDLANGMLQFSIVGNRPNPTDWPDYLDQAKLIQFLHGYFSVTKLEAEKLQALPDLMIETMIAEGVVPIATTGFFGNFTGVDFLGMIQRKATWINNYRETLLLAMKS